MAWYVKYRVAGFPCDFTQGPFSTAQEANLHATDIGGFEGISDVEIYQITNPEAEDWLPEDDYDDSEVR